MSLRFSIILFLVLFIAVLKAQTKRYHSEYVQSHGDFVPDSTTAVKVAEAILVNIYEDDLKLYKPFKANLINNEFWRITGTSKFDKGGPPIIEIQKSDCKVLGIKHDK